MQNYLTKMVECHFKNTIKNQMTMKRLDTFNVYCMLVMLIAINVCYLLKVISIL